MIILDKINPRKKVVQSNKHSYDVFLSYIKKHGTYLGNVGEIDYYYCQGYVCNIIYELKNNVRDIVGSGLTCDMQRIPKKFIDAYPLTKLKISV
jgi:hypothetical protein